jgi:hypothetical protein
MPLARLMLILLQAIYKGYITALLKHSLKAEDQELIRKIVHSSGCFHDSI